ncbi:MAG TPA: UvrB/UvrC motif-containing protein [Kiritimatiellia bacterium]|nr:UvrB/UvrC motif-containing protein [Kiritimatiellia bacterium]HRZ11532.1 UvrB/UvrC motif-containing protein [Kiritimatiellia bacterium]HSA16917.1 UvrB/UvrC motif-containing protein [Kiritimatiellia bacterium]
MNSDLSPILRGWDYDPGRVNARWIIGRDGRLKVQLRLDLGVLQMEPEGRPDGRRPRGHDSLLDYYRSLQADMPALDPAACAELQQEAMQYYYRYLAFHALRHFDGVIRDTEHNLELLNLVEHHAADDDMAWAFLQFYPYIRMMNARARAEKNMREQRETDAVSILQEAVSDIRSFWRRQGEEGAPPGSPEIEALTDLLGRIRRQGPRSRGEELREDLARAIAEEKYEDAARLRDQLRDIGEP